MIVDVNNHLGYSETRAFESIPKLATALRYTNVITCIKELHAIGGITDAEYQTALREIIKEHGVTL